MAEKKVEAPKFRFEENPTLTETFADSIGNWYFDGNTLRVDFLVSRLDPGKTDHAPTGRKVPVCRLVLAPHAAMELINRVHQLSGALEKAGFLKKKTPDQASTKDN